MSNQSNKTTPLPDWAVAEVESLNETIRRQRERDAIAREFGFNPHTMAAEIQRLRWELEEMGESAGICVGRALGRRCRYCRCEGRNLK